MIPPTERLIAKAYVMVNGKPGDHPLTDILNHRIETYGSEADELIRKSGELSSPRELDE